MPGDPAQPARPLDAASFAALIEPLGPFEARPDVAVAVSGGADSLCLCLLADRWARGKGGRAVGLIVDHGLRPGSAAEAARVAEWLGARGIAGHVLHWQGPKPRHGVQAAARDARYRLLTGWCRGAGVLHLLLAHHREDQAETVFMRRERASGADGLAAMPAVHERDGVRLVRPLLTVGRARLRATLERLGQAWIEDPSNRDPAFARSRLRRDLGADPAAVDELAALARRMGEARAARETALARLLAGSVRIHPAGHCLLDPEALGRAPPDQAARALARVLRCVGGGDYAPREARLARLAESLRTRALGGGRTLAGCLVRPYRHRVLVCREPAAVRHRLVLAPGEAGLWDRRFAVRLDAGAQAACTVRKLGQAGWRIVRAHCPQDAGARIPAPVRETLPAFHDLDGVLAVPHLNYWRTRAKPGIAAVFRPAHPLAGPSFWCA